MHHNILDKTFSSLWVKFLLVAAMHCPLIIVMRNRREEGLPSADTKDLLSSFFSALLVFFITIQTLPASKGINEYDQFLYTSVFHFSLSCAINICSQYFHDEQIDDSIRRRSFTLVFLIIAFFYWLISEKENEFLGVGNRGISTTIAFSIALVGTTIDFILSSIATPLSETKREIHCLAFLILFYCLTAGCLGLLFGAVIILSYAILTKNNGNL